MSYEFKGFVNRLSYDCNIDIDRDVSTANCRSSSVFQLFNDQRKLGRKEERTHKLSLFYHEEHRSRNSLKRCREKKNRSKKYERNMMLKGMI